MPSKVPVFLDNVSPLYIDQQILRYAVSAEYDAISLYEQMGFTATDPRVKKVLNSVAKEEKTHVGEFESVLNMIDGEQVIESDKGKEEVMSMLGVPSRAGVTYYPQRVRRY